MKQQRQDIIDKLQAQFPHLNIFADEYSQHIICIDEKTQQEVLVDFNHDLNLDKAKALLASSKIGKPMLAS
jgi:hypothetical protein